MRNFTADVRRFLKSQDGATAIEYAIIAGGIAAAIVVTVNALGVSVKGMFTAVANLFG